MACCLLLPSKETEASSTYGSTVQGCTQTVSCGDRQDQLEQIAKKLEGPLVVQKGAKDGISNGKQTIYCEGNGSKRRAGGQVCCQSYHTFLV